MKSIDDLKREVEEVKARAALPALSPAEEELSQLRAELARAKSRVRENERRARDAREDAIFEELEIEHANESIHRIDSESGMIVMRTPTLAKARHFQQVALKGKLGVDAIEDFVKPCVLYPKGDELELRLDRCPMLAATLCQFAQQAASDEAERRGKK